MDRRSWNKLWNEIFRKNGLVLAICIAIGGLSLMILLSSIFSLIGIPLKLDRDITYSGITSVLSRLLTFIILVIVSDMFGLCGRMGFGFKNFRNSICHSTFGFAIAFAFLLDAVSINLFLKNSIDLVSLFWIVLECLSVGLFEEVLCRGLVMNILKIRFRKKGKIVYVLIQAMIFSILHSINYIFGVLTIRQLITQLIVTFIMGFYYGLIYENTNSLFGVALLHGFYDICVSSSAFFLPTGETGFVYSDVGISLILYTILFTCLFALLRRLIVSIQALKEYEQMA